MMPMFFYEIRFLNRKVYAIIKKYDKNMEKCKSMCYNDENKINIIYYIYYHFKINYWRLL